MTQHRVLLSWSSGKDSAYTLQVLRQMPEYEVAGLVTTVTDTFQRVAMHGVRETLLQQQAAAAGLPVWRLPIPYPCSHEEYARVMSGFLAEAREAGVTHMAFGDLFLEDVRAYREERLKDSGITPIFPLWGRDTQTLAREMVECGMEATLVVVDPRRLPERFAGRRFDTQLLADLPTGVDPCGENGEYHTFCHAGPMFSHPIPVSAGEVVTRDGFVFADLLPAAL